MTDVFGNNIVRYCGAYSYSEDNGDNFTYEIVKVAVLVGEKIEYCYRLYGYHGFTFDCSTKGFFVNGVEAQTIPAHEAIAILRGKAMESTLLTEWERSILRDDHERLDNWNF